MPVPIHPPNCDGIFDSRRAHLQLRRLCRLRLLLLLQCDNVPWRTRPHLRPVSIPDIVRTMAGKNPVHEMAGFDRHYMPGGLPSPDASARGNADDHHSELKRKADGISSSLSEVFAYLTHETASLEEAKKLLTIITNVNYILIHCLSCQFDFCSIIPIV